MNNNTYNLNQENGELSRKGEVIGTFNGETGELVIADAKFNKYKASATRFINSLAESSSTESNSENSSVSSNSEEKAVPSKNEASDEEKAAMEKESSTAIATAKASNDDDKKFAAKNGCPTPPKKNPMYGDKTPAYVEWLKEHRPDVFNAKYGVTGPGKVPVVDDLTGEVTGYRDATMATRKNHLTDKEASNEGLSEDESWDA